MTAYASHVAMLAAELTAYHKADRPVPPALRDAAKAALMRRGWKLRERYQRIDHLILALHVSDIEEARRAAL